MSRSDAASCASFAAEAACPIAACRPPPPAAACGGETTGLGGSAVRRLRLAMRRSSTRARYDVSTCNCAYNCVRHVITGTPDLVLWVAVCSDPHSPDDATKRDEQRISRTLGRLHICMLLDSGYYRTGAIDWVEASAVMTREAATRLQLLVGAVQQDLRRGARLLGRLQLLGDQEQLRGSRPCSRAKWIKTALAAVTVGLGHKYGPRVPTL